MQIITNQFIITKTKHYEKVNFISTYRNGYAHCIPNCWRGKGQQEEREKAYEWKWDGTKSGNETVDAYLMSVDSIWNNMSEFHKMVDTYQYKEDTLYVNGKYYVQAYMKDDQGNLLTRGAVNWQFVNCGMLSANIISQAALAAMQSANATLALPNLGLKALSFGKYVKAGPVICTKAPKEIGLIWNIRKQQMKSWRGLKAEAIDATKVYPNMTAEQKKLYNKCVFIREVKETAPDYQEIKTVLSAKSEDELKKESQASFDKLAQSVILPEEAGKSLDDLSDDAMKEYM